MKTKTEEQELIGSKIEHQAPAGNHNSKAVKTTDVVVIRINFTYQTLVFNPTPKVNE